MSQQHTGFLWGLSTLFALFFVSPCTTFAQASAVTPGGCGITPAFSSMNDSIPGDLLLEDLDQLKAGILEIHPDPFIYTSKASFDEAFELAKAEAQNGLTYRDFAALVSRTIRVMRDSHSLLQYSSYLSNYRRNEGGFVSFSIRQIDGKVYVEEDRQSILPAGSELLSIHGQSATKLFRQTQAFSIYEGNSIAAFHRVSEVLFPSLLGGFVPLCEETPIRILPAGSQDTLELTYPALSGKGLKKFNKRLPRKHVHELRWAPGDAYAVLRIGSFDHRSQKTYRRFLRRSFKTLEKNGVKHLALDIRGNTGGRSSRVEELLTYLAPDREVIVPKVLIARQSEASAYRFKKEFPPFSRFLVRILAKKNEDAMKFTHIADLPIGSLDTVYFETPEPKDRKFAYRENLYLFMDGLSGSASANFSALFQTMRLGTSIGEPCLGPSSGTWGNPVPLSLGNSHLRVYVASIRFNLESDFVYPPLAIVPDIRVYLSQEGLKDERDECEAALQKLLQSQGR